KGNTWYSYEGKIQTASSGLTPGRISFTRIDGRLFYVDALGNLRYIPLSNQGAAPAGRPGAIFLSRDTSADYFWGVGSTSQKFSMVHNDHTDTTHDDYTDHDDIAHEDNATTHDDIAEYDDIFHANYTPHSDYNHVDRYQDVSTPHDDHDDYSDNSHLDHDDVFYNDGTHTDYDDIPHGDHADYNDNAHSDHDDMPHGDHAD